MRKRDLKSPPSEGWEGLWSIVSGGAEYGHCQLDQSSGNTVSEAPSLKA